MSQVDDTLLDLAENFKAPLELGVCAVSPETSNVQNPPLLLVINGKTEMRIKEV